MIDAIDEDEKKIRQIADRLQRHGYGVMRQRHTAPGALIHLQGDLGWSRIHWTTLSTRSRRPEYPSKSSLFMKNGAEKTFAVVFETGDEAMAGFQVRSPEPPGRRPIHGDRCVRGATLGFFDWQSKVYRRSPFPRAGPDSLSGRSSRRHREPNYMPRGSGRSTGTAREASASGPRQADARRLACRVSRASAPDTIPEMAWPSFACRRWNPGASNAYWAGGRVARRNWTRNRSPPS